LLCAKSVSFMLLISSVLLNVLQIDYAFKLLRNLVYREGTVTPGNDETAHVIEELENENVVEDFANITSPAGKSFLMVS